MNANEKSTGALSNRRVAKEPEGGKAPPATVSASVFRIGLVRFAEIQRAALDQLVQQNMDFQSAWKQTYDASSWSGTKLVDLAAKLFQEIADIQKSLMDLAIDQSAFMVEISKEGPDWETRHMAVGEMVRQSMDKLIAAERVVIAYAATHNALVIDGMKRQFGLLNPPTESINHDTGVIIGNGKELTGIASKPIKIEAAVSTASL